MDKSTVEPKEKKDDDESVTPKPEEKDEERKEVQPSLAQLFMAKWLASSIGSLSIEEKEKLPKKLDSFDLAGVTKYLLQCKKIICLVGAGISTSAGIPDFRTPGTGLYSQLEKYDLPYPEAIFALDYFKENPEPFFKLAKEIFPKNYKPTPCHYFLRLLHEKKQLLRIYSQNIDMLEQLAGIPESYVVNAHGSFSRGHCVSCNHEYSFEWLEKNIKEKDILKCGKCNDGLVKPDIVFFGESLPNEFFEKGLKDTDECDLLLIMGTSLNVQPVSILPSVVPKECPRVLLNLEPVGMGFYYNNPDENYRDVFLKGSCDQSCLDLAKALKWDKELEDLINGKNKSDNKSKAASDNSKPKGATNSVSKSSSSTSTSSTSSSRLSTKNKPTSSTASNKSTTTTKKPSIPSKPINKNK